MDLAEIRRKYRFETSEKEIIKWLTWNLTSERARLTVQNHLKEDGEEARRAGCEVKKFHDLIMNMNMDEQFEGARLSTGHGWKGRDSPKPEKNSK